MTSELQRELTRRADAACRYKAVLGWPVIVTHGVRHGICTCPAGDRCGRQGKHPTMANYQRTADDDLATLRSRFALVPFNVALLIPSTIVVFDLDNRGGLPLLHRFKPWPITPTSITARGFHSYFRWPFDAPSPSVGGLDKLPVDIKGAGQLITLPPSTNANGHARAWRNGESPFDMPLALLPDAFARFVQRIAAARAKQRTPDASAATFAGALQLASRRAQYAGNTSNGAGRGAVGLRRTLEAAGARAEVIAAALGQFHAEAGQ